MKIVIRVGVSIVVLVLFAAILVVACGLHDDLTPADVALVLGNTVKSDGTPSPRLKARLDRTVELYRQGLFPLVLASGGAGKEGHDEGVVMRDYLVAQGIPAESVVADSLGNNTFASARNTRAFLDAKNLRSVMVISQYFHIPRARVALWRCGVSPVYWAHAHYFEARDFYCIGREIGGFPVYLFLRKP